MDLNRRLDGIRRQFRELGEAVASEQLAAERAPSISGWSVGEHVEHLGRAHGPLFARLAELAVADDPALAHGKLNVRGRVVLLFGRIPRGKGRAPERSRPTAGGSASAAQAALAELVAGFERLVEHRSGFGALRARLDHPYFGRLGVFQWLRFAEVHQRHHLRIVREIQRAAGNRSQG